MVSESEDSEVFKIINSGEDPSDYGEAINDAVAKRFEKIVQQYLSKETLAAHKEKMPQQFAEAFFCASHGMKIGQIFSLIIVTFFYILAYNGT